MRGLLLVWVLFIWPIAANAQELFGTLSDEGVPVPQAEVVLLFASNNVLLKRTKTNQRGEYRIEVEPGTYNLKASQKDYADAWVKNVVVNRSTGTVEVNITLIPQVFEDSRVVPESDDCE